ncbi:hypothetical protein GCM10011491_41280 [Brucella endophytica]|uniref:Uncharacterized protein n=1 Tax=Brucella endophytica TaxID=1963359 RepID=A0A916SN41_9HYPH|nr:hypothetical protein GCM10011491_41280 [Brucella endophytica]
MCDWETPLALAVDRCITPRPPVHSPGRIYMISNFSSEIANKKLVPPVIMGGGNKLSELVKCLVAYRLGGDAPVRL